MKIQRKEIMRGQKQAEKSKQRQVLGRCFEEKKEKKR